MFEILDKIRRVSGKVLMELETCTRCSICADTCPTYLEVKEPSLVPGGRAALFLRLYRKKTSLIRKLLGNGEISEDEVKALLQSSYNCTLCGRCMEACPFGFQTVEMWTEIRLILYEEGFLPNELRGLSQNLHDQKNPYGMDPSTRIDWVDYTGLEEPSFKDKAKIVYFVGCTSSFKAVDQEIPYAASLILNHVKADWTLLGEEEVCCGGPSIMHGDIRTAIDLARKNVNEIEKKNAEVVVVTCPTCYRVLKWEYPRLIGRKPRFNVTFFLQYIHDLLKKGTLNLKKKDERITYHDPCELSRHSGFMKEAREIIKQLTTNFLEMEERGVHTRCCGGGGLLQATHNDVRLKISEKRIRQALDLKPAIIATSCPTCKMTLHEASLNHDVKVLDLVELVAANLGVM